MNRKFVIGTLGTLILLGIIASLFVIRTTSTDATRGRSAATSVAATPTSSGSSNSETQLTQQLFNQINSDRAAQGLPAYTWDDKIATVSRQHSVTMGQGCGLSHQCSGEPDPCQRLSNAGIQWMACGENVGYTTPTPDAWSAVKTNIEQGMLSEQPPNDGHRRNLLSASIHRIGIGTYIDSKGIIWVTEDFTN
jgi:uncharacterized protein YkwD